MCPSEQVRQIVESGVTFFFVPELLFDDHYSLDPAVVSFKLPFFASCHILHE